MSNKTLHQSTATREVLAPDTGLVRQKEHGVHTAHHDGWTYTIHAQSWKGLSTKDFRFEVFNPDGQLSRFDVVGDAEERQGRCRAISAPPFACEAGTTDDPA